MADIQNKHVFMMSKVTNFRSWLQTMKPSDEAQAMINGFNELLILPTILAHLLPASKQGRLGEVANQVFASLTEVPEGKEEEVKIKIQRYLQCFVDVSSS